MISLTRDCLGWHKGAAAISGTLSNNQKGLSLRICIQRDSPFFLYTIPLPPKKDGLPAIVLAGSPAVHKQRSPHPSPVPPAGEAEMRQHLGVRGVTPAGVQRAAPFGAPRVGALPA